MSDYDDLVAETMAKRPEVDAILTKKAQRARIASALRALRSRKGLSQRQLSARTGWSQPFIARIESVADDQMPAPETIVRYVEACGAKVGLVFLDQESGRYHVGDAVALTDDAEAAGYLAELAEARAETRLAGRRAEKLGLTDRAELAALEEAVRGEFESMFDEATRRFVEDRQKLVRATLEEDESAPARVTFTELSEVARFIQERIDEAERRAGSLLIPFFMKEAKETGAVQEALKRVVHALIEEQEGRANEASQPRTAGRRPKRAPQGRPSGKGAS